MALLIVEDGTGIEGANSFVTEAEIIAYAAMRGQVITPADATKFGIAAMDFFDTLCFGGDAKFDTPFPRSMWAGIPAPIRKAQMQLALDVSRGIVLTASSNFEPMLKREKTGPLESEWFTPGDAGFDASKPRTPIADGLLYPYTCDANPGGFTLRTIRA